MAISSISSNVISTSQYVVKANTTKAQTENTQSSVNSTAYGDTVTISDEAQNRLQSVQATSSADTTDTTGTTATAQSATTESSSSGGAVASAPAQSGTAASASPGAASGTSTSSAADPIAKLEKQVQALQNEITALAAKALTDETAKSEMASKQAEMAGLTAELTQLQAKQA